MMMLRCLINIVRLYSRKIIPVQLFLLVNESAYFPNFSPSLGITILFNLCKFDEKWSYFASLWLLVIIIFYHYSLEIFLVTFKQYMCFSWFISFIKGLLMSQFFYRDFYWFIFPFSDSAVLFIYKWYAVMLCISCFIDSRHIFYLILKLGFIL